jgi:hypothetical protein
MKRMYILFLLFFTNYFDVVGQDDPFPTTPVITSPVACSIQISPVTIAGTADPNTDILINIGAGVTFTTLSSNTGFWSVTTTLTPGSYVAIVEAESAGSFSNPSFVSFFVRTGFSPLAQAILAKYCCEQEHF